MCLRWVHPAHQADIAHRSQLGAKAVFLKDRTNISHALHGAGIRCFQPHQDTQQGGFSAAGGSHQHQRTVYRQVQIPQNRNTAKGFVQVFYLDHPSTSPQRARLARRSAQAASVLSVADSSTITSVQANTSGVEMVILAR